MEKLKRQRSSKKSKFTRVQAFVDGCDIDALPPISQLKTRFDILNNASEEVQENHNEIVDLVDPADLDAEETEFGDLETRFINLKTELQKFMDLAEVTQGSTSSSSSGTSIVADVKLPRMDLPTFSGNPMDWTSFHDLFVSIIHNNMKIQDSQKLHYLKNSLRDEAAGLIQSIEVTNANYPEAWKLLTERYQNERRLIHCHLKSLFSQQKMNDESSTQLMKLWDDTTKCTRALNGLGLNTDDWDPLIVFLITDRLDQDSRRHWELQSPGTSYPKLKELKSFIEQRCRALEATTNSKSKTTGNKSGQQRSTTMAHQTCIDTSCGICKSAHFIYQCPEFNAMEVRERSAIVKKLALCFNCLRPSHPATKCQSKSSCRKCNGRHHSLLHFDKPPSTGESSTVARHFSDQNSWSSVLLSTATANAKDSSGQLQNCRILLDGGSQASFISETCVKRLGLRRSKADVSITGIGHSGSVKAKGRVCICLKSHYSNFTIQVDVLIMSKITGNIPSSHIPVADWDHLENLNLADPKFNHPNQIDILLGADIYNDLFTNGKVTGSSTLPTARNTHLGWILSGRIGLSNGTKILSHLSTTDVNFELQKFWEIEEVGSQSTLTNEEVQCESHFEDTFTRDSAGRFVTQLPFKCNINQLGSSFDIAMRRLIQVEKRLSKNLDYQQQYSKFMDEYIRLGHMEPVPSHQLTESCKTNFLPHHFVLKESSSTTSFRVVFDASVHTTNGQSLNQNLMVGPKLQDDMYQILLRFRFHRYAITADICKIYCQILIVPEHQDFLRILWRSSPNDPVQQYRLLTVTYGTASAPYTATKCLRKLAELEGDSYPLAKVVTLRDFCVDDVMSGANSESEAIRLQGELIEMLERGGFQLRKWSSNSTAIVEAVPPEYRESNKPISIDSDDSIKALGLHWNTSSDTFYFVVNLPLDSKSISKRTILSETSKLYDPLGWISPVLILAKIFIQKLWIFGVSWDEKLPAELEDNWKTYRQQLFDLDKIKIQRYIGADVRSYQIHGFSDASEQAYGAVLYLRTEREDGIVTVELMCSKTKVCPLQQKSLPRLELCGALLLSRLVKKVLNALTVTIESVTGWSDSTVALDWICGHPTRWKTFIANRVSEIQDVLPPESWKHVPGTDNPSDFASRGVLPSQMPDLKLWWNGPAWLVQDESFWPKKPLSTTSDAERESKPVKLKVFNATVEHWDLINRCSTLTKLKRVTAFCLRFTKKLLKRDQIKPYNLRSSSSKVKDQIQPLTTEELHAALIVWIKLVQSQQFQDDIDHLSKNKPVSNLMKKLNPFVDPDGILRVGGRLTHSKLHYDKKHPILLPKISALTDLIIAEEHVRLGHGGSQLVAASLAQKFWILGSRQLIRDHIFHCVRCFRDKASSSTSEQFMGDLPDYRVQPTRPFLKSGVDFGGPFDIKSVKGRGGKITKAYLCLFVCVSTKCVHLELVSDLTSEAFIASLRRFVARRGICSHLFTDNGTNFIGANVELQKLHKLMLSQMTDFCSSQGIQWEFIPPRSPHFGGLWEAGIKSTKMHLRRIIGDNPQTFEEMTTVLTQIEAILNSRPLCPLSSDPADLSVLTPGHLLIGESLMAIPEPNLIELKLNRLSRWQFCQQAVQHFWKRWQMEYLSTLQQRPKWVTKNVNMTIGDLVLIKEDNLPPLKWMMGRVIETHPGKDDLVRVVSVKTIRGIFKRPIVKLCLLPIQN